MSNNLIRKSKSNSCFSPETYLVHLFASVSSFTCEILKLLISNLFEVIWNLLWPQNIILITSRDKYHHISETFRYPTRYVLMLAYQKILTDFDFDIDFRAE